MQSWVEREKKQFVGDMIPRTGYRRGGVLQRSEILLKEGIKPHIGLPRPGSNTGRMNSLSWFETSGTKSRN